MLSFLPSFLPTFLPSTALVVPLVKKKHKKGPSGVVDVPELELLHQKGQQDAKMRTQ